MNIESTLSRKEEREILTHKIVNGPNDTTFVTGPADVTITSTRVVTKYQGHSIISIPLALGFHKNFGNNWNIQGHVGANVNLLFFHDKMSYIINGPNLSFTAVQGAVTQNIYRRDLWINPFAGIQLSYDTDSGLSYFIEPEFHYLGKTVTHEEYSLNQKYLVGQVKLGLRLKL